MLTEPILPQWNEVTFAYVSDENAVEVCSLCHEPKPVALSISYFANGLSQNMTVCFGCVSQLRIQGPRPC